MAMIRGKSMYSRELNEKYYRENDINCDRQRVPLGTSLMRF